MDCAADDLYVTPPTQPWAWLKFFTGAFTIMGDIYDTQTRQWVPDGRHLVRQQDFWYVMGMTTWIVLPWICTREVPVDIELVINVLPWL